VIKRLIIVLVALTLLYGGIFGWKYIQSQKSAARASMPPPPATVATARVQPETWQPRLSAVGSLVATQGVFVSNEIAGQVTDIRFESGQAVAAGELLVQLDDDVDRASLASLLAEQRLADIQFQRAAKLVNEKLVSRSDYDAAKAALDSAAAQVDSQRARISKKAIRAPFTGLLGIRRVDLGQYLAPGSEIVSLQSLDPIYAEYSLPERHLSELAVAQPVEVSVAAYPGRTFAGRISAVSPRIDVSTRSVRLRATLENPQQLLRPGMFAEVHTLLPARGNVLTLPARAITYNPYGDSVFAVEENDGTLRVQRRQVQTGEERGGRVEIVTGLEAGAQVVAAGQNKLRNGQSVEIDNSVELKGRVGE
jgi:membrane fusion protein (multidrug efflux system)